MNLQSVLLNSSSILFVLHFAAAFLFMILGLLFSKKKQAIGFPQFPPLVLSFWVGLAALANYKDVVNPFGDKWIWIILVAACVAALVLLNQKPSSSNDEKATSGDADTSLGLFTIGILIFFASNQMDQTVAVYTSVTMVLMVLSLAPTMVFYFQESEWTKRIEWLQAVPFFSAALVTYYLQTPEEKPLAFFVMLMVVLQLFFATAILGLSSAKDENGQSPPEEQTKFWTNVAYAMVEIIFLTKIAVIGLLGGIILFQPIVLVVLTAVLFYFKKNSGFLILFILLVQLLNWNESMNNAQSVLFVLALFFQALALSTVVKPLNKFFVVGLWLAAIAATIAAIPQ